jgi:hypothetical protein
MKQNSPSAFAVGLFCFQENTSTQAFIQTEKIVFT